MSYGATDRGSWRRVDWKYDAWGRRVRQTSYVLSNGVWQVVEDLKLVSDPLLFGRHIAELNATNNALVRAYVWGLDLSETLDGAGGVGGLLWIRVAGGPAASTHFVTYDGNGNVWNLVSASTGTETARYEYGPFGEALRLSGPAAHQNPFRFSTKRTEDFTGLVLYEYRPYSPTSGRWLSRDPIEEGGGACLHAFAANCASSNIDLYGWEIFEVVVWTYIETPTVEAPWLLKKRLFRGDNHGPGGGSYRTIHRIVIETCGPSKGLIPGSEWKDTGITEELNPTTHAVIATGKASGSTLKASVTTTASQVIVNMEGDESNPLVEGSPGITYWITITFDTKAGVARYTGKHDEFPAYEFYIGPTLVKYCSHVAAGTTVWALFPPANERINGSMPIMKCCP